ncbi:Putrescine utilization regulator [Enterobacter cloacae]|uniref:Putrescine utilization regulator n=1 Tax=Enterobacter cloacae TaxID=550 RepID=A0A377M2S1_ENTCL|nr:Putrescine utilization regulator [Enterobacter cloacae]
MKLVHNGNPNRTLAMIFETYQPGTTTGERIKHQGEEIGTILEGEIVLTINGQPYHLVAGKAMPLIPAYRTASATPRQASAALSVPTPPPRSNYHSVPA